MAFRGRLLTSILSGYVSLFAHSATAQAPTPLTAELQQLHARNDEWRREDGLFRSQREANKLGGTELTDYAEFVASLKLRLIAQCEVVRKLGGEAAIAPYDCLHLATSLPPSLTISSGTNVRTEAESQQSTLARLDQLEASIDEDLLKKQRELRESAQQTTMASNSGGGGNSAGGGGAGATQGSGAGGAAGGTNARTGNATANGTRGGGQNAGEGTTVAGRTTNTTPAPGAPSNSQRSAQIVREQSNERGTDDDIVARQLREAAERERDPILKEKLWNEYNKYKNAQR